ncbi:MAG: right-handed parallel beta-helix repeat-containing protein [Candidatus Levybacteria bacterium]|nr:right-handed parallel beta-helix repeat-containing protein [Candidatus Levybacteria bacterium]
MVRPLLLLTAVISVFFVSILSPSSISAATQTFYVSPTGSDTNPGTQIAPWKTFYKASQTAVAGDLVLFEDGIYAESQQASIRNSGTSSLPIIFKARNKHKAILRYSGPTNSVKILNNGKKYITIADFEITQTTRGSSSSDKLIDFSTGSDYGVISGNKIHNAFEDLIKMYDADFGIIEGNELSDSTREGIDFMIGNGVIIRNNVLRNTSRQALMVKGGARNAQVYNNTIIQDTGTMYVAIGLGGSSDNIYAYDDSGYEGYHQVAFNNVVVARSPGVIQEALKMEGCDTCAHFNNVVVGADKAIVVTKGPGLSKNWTWDVLSRDPVFKNNIIMDCRVSTRYIPDTIQGTLTIDYNLIYNCPSPPTQVHGVSSDPKFVNKLSDWHLQASSPAIGKGEVIAPFPTFSDANTPLTPPVNTAFDVTGAVRTDPWDMGIYESGVFLPTPTSTPIPLKYFTYAMRDNPAEYFIVKMTDEADIQQAMNDYLGERRLIVSGKVVSGSGGFNRNETKYWSWHLDPSTIVLGEVFTEVCDGRPSYVENTLSDWLGKTYCPWGASVTAVSEMPPGPITGDINRDGKVDLLDFNIWRDEFLGNVATKSADLNGDGTVDLVDFNLWLTAYKT